MPLLHLQCFQQGQRVQLASDGDVSAACKHNLSQALGMVGYQVSLQSTEWRFIPARDMERSKVMAQLQIAELYKDKSAKM